MRLQKGIFPARRNSALVQKARACIARVAELFRENKRGKDDESSKLERRAYVYIIKEESARENFVLRKIISSFYLALRSVVLKTSTTAITSNRISCSALNIS